MITFHKLGKYGRLGNQLFQYAALKSLALKNSYEVKIPKMSGRSIHGQISPLEKFNINCETLQQTDVKYIKSIYVEPDWKRPDYNFFNLPDGVSIEGYFQSTFYFNEFKDQIKKELTPKDVYLKEGRSYIENLKSEYPNHQIVSIHIRRGDNLLNNQQGLIDAFKPGGVFETYMRKALDIFEHFQVKFLVFTGGARGDENNNDDIRWCKEFFGDDDRFIYSEGQSQMIDFTRIMHCDHNILSHASSFGWWAAYQNVSLSAMKVAPEFYHPDHLTLKRPEFYPLEYVLV